MSLYFFLLFVFLENIRLEILSSASCSSFSCNVTLLPYSAFQISYAASDIIQCCNMLCLGIVIYVVSSKNTWSFSSNPFSLGKLHTFKIKILCNMLACHINSTIIAFLAKNVCSEILCAANSERNNVALEQISLL